MTLSLAVATSKDECDAHHGLPTLADPLELEDLQSEFADVTFELIYRTDEDPCSGCPDACLTGPQSADVVLVYRWWGHWVRQPAGMCCATSELRELTDSDAVTDLRVEVLVEGPVAA